MPDQSQIQPFSFNCEGGLVLNKSTFIMEPGQALELTNFEPDVEGGYRRINGFEPYVFQQVPETTLSTPSTSLNTASVHQKHPPPTVIRALPSFFIISRFSVFIGILLFLV